MNDYEYIVLTYGPQCTAEAVGVCMVIIQGRFLDRSTEVVVYVPTQNPGMLPHHWEYLMTLANEWHALSSGIDHLLDSLKELSTGPLRLEMSGTCRQTQVNHLLMAQFNNIKYEAAPRPPGHQGRLLEPEIDT